MVKPKVITVVFDILKGQSEAALKVVDTIADYKKMIEGEEVYPYVVNLKTKPFLDREVMLQVYRGELDTNNWTRYPASQQKEPDEFALRVLNRDNVVINSSKSKIEHWRNTAIIFMDNNGKIDLPVWKWKDDEVPIDEADDDRLIEPRKDGSMNELLVKGGYTRPRVGRKRTHYIAYNKHILVIPEVYSLPKPGKVKHAKRLWVLNPKRFLEKSWGKCDQCGQQARFMICHECGKELKKYGAVCAKCGSPLKHLGNGKYQCVDRKECQAPPIKKVSIRKEFRNKWTCGNPLCKTKLDEEEFAKQIATMICTNGACKSKKIHEQIVYTGPGFEHIDILDELHQVEIRQ